MKQACESQRTPTNERVHSTYKGRLADGVVQGQSTCSKKNKVQMLQKKEGVEAQIKKKDDSS